MPINDHAVYDGYYNCSKECWIIYSDVLGTEFSNAVLFSQVHQLTVDTYAVQHAGGNHTDKSVAVHLAGLHAALDLEVPQMQISGLRQRLAANISLWPHFEPPRHCGPLTIFEIALATGPKQHVERVRKWSQLVWQSWSQHHASVAELVSAHS